MFKIYLKKIFASLGLLPLIEKINYQKLKYKNTKKNLEFTKKNPSIVMPPDYFMYETFALDYHKIYFGGLETAQWIIDHFTNHLKFEGKKILDWGCGSGRIIRHIPSIIDKSNSIYGTDYNPAYATWCQNNIQNVIIQSNKLSPPLNYEKDFFDAIYGISIVTHLSEEMHELWIEELHRILKRNGYLLLTTHGKCYKEKLTSKEKELFDAGKLVEHTYKTEGNRLFAAYQPASFFKNLCESKGFKIIKHIEESKRNNKPQQDVWILQKK